MRLAKASVLEDPEAGEAGDDSGDDVQLADPISPGDLLVADQGEESRSHGNEANGRVEDSQRRQTQHSTTVRPAAACLQLRPGRDASTTRIYTPARRGALPIVHSRRSRSS